MDLNRKPSPHVVELNAMFNAEALLAKMLGASDADINAAIKVMYAASLLVYLQDKNDLSSINETVEKLMSRLDAFEKDLLDKPF